MKYDCLHLVTRGYDVNAVKNYIDTPFTKTVFEMTEAIR